MPAFTLSLIVLVAYLLGSIPFGYLLVRLFRSEDIRKTGSGNIGATNVIRSGAKGLGAATFVLDALKGFLAVVVARELVMASLPAWPPIAQLAWQTSPMLRLESASALAGLVAVLGHIFPIWLRFKGGKGVATALGAMLALTPIAALVGLGFFIVTFALSRYVSLASLVATLAVPTAAILLPPHVASLREGHSPWLLAVLLIIPALLFAKHSANIRRLTAGTEYRFGRAKTR